jgi:hypothetical protein
MTLLQRCESLPNPWRAILALGAIPVLGAVSWVLFIVPVTALYDGQQGWREDAKSKLARAKGTASQSAELDRQLELLPSAGIWSKFYIVDSAGAAASAIQMDVGALLNAVHAAVQSMTPLRSAEAVQSTTVGLRVSASMTIDQLKSFLQSLSSHPRYLRVDRLRVNAPLSQTPNTNTVLTVTLEIVGMERLRTQPPPAASTVAAASLAQGNASSIAQVVHR